MTTVSNVEIVKINELNENLVRNPNALLAFYNPGTGETQSIKASVLTGGEGVDITWKNTTTYSEDEVVEFQDKLWKSRIDANLNNPPSEGAIWTEVSKSEGDGTIGYWSAGVYTVSPTTVINNNSLYILNDTVAMPYESTDFDAEYAAGDWLSGGSNLFNFIDFNPQSTAPAHTAGRLYFDSLEDALTYYNSESDVSLQIGRELWVRCVNNSGGLIANGKNVYIETADIATMLPQIGIANCCTYTKSRIIGKATHSIEDGTIGYVAFFGVIKDYNTTAFTAGDTLYLTETGDDTNIFPVGGAYTTRIGTVLESAANGSVQLNVSTSEYTVETLQQTGWPDVANLNISFDDLTRTLTVAPINNINVRYYEKGVKYFVEEPGDTFQISDVTGLHFIYYSNGSITEIIDPTLSQEVSVLTNNPVVTSIYWRAGDRNIYSGNQAHNSIGYGSRQIALDHIKTGAQYILGSGLGLNDFSIDGNGSLNTHAQFSIASGQIVDSDIITTTNAFASTEGVDIAYLDSSLNWERLNNAGYSFLNTGTGRVAYQDPVTGGLVEAPDKTYVLYHLFANNDLNTNRTVLSVPGLEAHTSASNAESAADEEASAILAAAPIQEFVLVGIVIIQTRNSYSNDVKARIISTTDGANYIDKRDSGVSGGGGGSTPITVFSDDEFKIFDNVTLNELSFVLDNLTSNISLTAQNKSGTIALTNDSLQSDVLLTFSGTDTAATVNSALSAVQSNLSSYTLTLQFTQGTIYTIDEVIDIKRFYGGNIVIRSSNTSRVVLHNTLETYNVYAIETELNSNLTFVNIEVTSELIGPTGIMRVGTLTDEEHFGEFKAYNCNFTGAIRTLSSATVTKLFELNYGNYLFKNCAFGKADGSSGIKELFGINNKFNIVRVALETCTSLTYPCTRISYSNLSTGYITLSNSNDVVTYIDTVSNNRNMIITELPIGTGGTTITADNTEPYDDLNVEGDGFLGYRANRYVSYINAISPDPLFQINYLYLSRADVAQGISPEDDLYDATTNPTGKWERIGESAEIVADTSSCYVQNITELEAVINYKNGHDVIVRSKNSIYTFKEDNETGIKPNDGGVGSWVYTRHISLTQLIRIYTSVDDDAIAYWETGKSVLITKLNTNIDIEDPETGDTIAYVLNISSPALVTRTGTGLLEADFTIDYLGGGGGGAAYPLWTANAAESWDGSNFAPDLTESDLNRLNVDNGTTVLNFIAPTNVPAIDGHKSLILIDNSANNSAISVINFTGYVWNVGVQPSGLAVNAKSTLELKTMYGEVEATWKVRS